MGGRGASSGLDNNQFTIEKMLFHNEVTQIRDKANKLRDAMNSTGGVLGGIPFIRKKLCFCCEEYTLPVSTKYAQCDVCGWIDDPHQNRNIDSTVGKNPISLSEARERYRNYTC